MTETSDTDTDTDTSNASAAARLETGRRRRLLWLTLILLIILPIYLLLAAYLIGAVNAPVAGVDGATAARPLHWSIELLLYLAVGLVWALPLKRLTQGLGKRDVKR